MHVSTVGDGALRLHQLHHSAHDNAAHREENRKGHHGFQQAKSNLFFPCHRILDQKGNVFRAATVACGTTALPPTAWLALASTVICFRPTEPAGTVICQTRTYSQLAVDATSFPLAST